MLNRIYASFNGEKDRTSLAELCLELLAEQKSTWSACCRGYASLEQIKVRKIACNGFTVLVQHNPGRIRSTLAGVEEKDIKMRPCFLCMNNLPEGQKGILYRNEYLILCNPAPVFSSHFTICHKEHRPQAIEEYVDALIQIMADLGSYWTVLYNGPRCGASAPDHLHFQAIPSGHMPAEAEIAVETSFSGTLQVNGVSLSRLSNIGREIIVLEGKSPISIAGTFRKTISELKRAINTDFSKPLDDKTGSDSMENKADLHGSATGSMTDIEPMINIAGFHNKGNFCLAVFPRAKHRPAAFFREGDARLMVSPAVVEMGGVLVTLVEKDFETMNASIAEGILREVSLDGSILDRVFR